jgi:hypothetical protein
MSPAPTAISLTPAADEPVAPATTAAQLTLGLAAEDTEHAEKIALSANGTHSLEG